MPYRASTAPCFALALVLATAVPAIAEESVWDPWESLNRATFSFNAVLYSAIAEPVTKAYQSALPQSVQTGLDDFFTNLREPVTAVSSALQGDFQNAGVSVGRFAINTTVGIVGIDDKATEMGWVSRPEDFGATLCSYGIRSGPYFVVPILGPTTVREAAGSLATFYTLGYSVTGDATVNYLITDRVVSTVSEKARATAAAAGDAYVAQRDAYVAFRDQVCKDAIPAKELKPNPFGSVAQKD